jgi:hypothetical protein
LWNFPVKKISYIHRNYMFLTNPTDEKCHHGKQACSILTSSFNQAALTHSRTSSPPRLTKFQPTLSFALAPPELHRTHQLPHEQRITAF